MKGKAKNAMLFIVVFLLALMPFTPGYAQFGDTANYYAGIMASGSINKTNSSSSYLTNQSLKLNMKKKLVSLNLSSSWVYGETQGKLTNNDVSTMFDVDLYKSIPHAYYWGLATYTSSVSLKINNQYQAGAGWAYNVVDKPNARLNLSDGILYEKSDIFLDDTVRDIYNTFRNSFRVMLRLKALDMITFNSICFIQNSLSYSPDYIFKTTNELEIKIINWLSLTCAYTYNKFNRTGKENTLFTYGLTVGRYF